MKVKVNKDTCIGCGACQAICPLVFEYDDEGLMDVKTSNLNDEVKEVLDKTVKETNNYTTEELIDFSHVKGGPWEKHKEGNGLIPKKEIYDFYKDKKNIYKI